MTILHPQNIAVTCCLILYISVSFERGTSENNTSQDFTGVNENCRKVKIKESGNYSLEIKENCNKYFVHLDFEDKTSIINLIISIQYLKQYEDSVERALNSKSTFNVTLCDLATNTDCKGKGVLKKEWQGNSSTVPQVIPYLSRSSSISIKISATGNLSYYEITFFCNEIPYRLIPCKSQDKSNTASCDYTPNSVTLLQLFELQTPQRGIEICFNNLTINTEMGEYLLIGAGPKPFGNKHSRPLYITEVADNSKFFVDDSSAFVAFVSSSLQRSTENEKFEIRWEGVKADAGKVEKVVVADSNSSLICFSNFTLALEEYKKKDGFEKFREHFATISETYLQGEYRGIKINNRSIDLSGQPMKPKEKDALAILIRVMYEGKSIFTWSTLQRIISESKEKGSRILGYEVDVCPPGNYALLNKEKWDIVFYAMVPVFGIFGLMMWAWKQNLFSQDCLTEKEEKVWFDPVHAEPNMYGTTTTPKLRYEEGRRDTIIQGPSLQEDAEGAKETTMVEMNAIPSTSQEPDTLTRYLSGKRNKSRPSLHSLFENVEEIKKQPHSGKTEEDEFDHLYDSVSSKQINETKL